MSKLGLIARIVLYGVIIFNMYNFREAFVAINERLNDFAYKDSAFDIQIEAFKREALLRNKDIDISKITVIFGKQEGNSVGLCITAHSQPFITIHKQFWTIYDQFEREELIFHELGHCVLDREHCEVKKNNKSVSMMEPNMLGSGYYGPNRENLVDELFNPDEGCR